jgi:hypothetical protein
MMMMNSAPLFDCIDTIEQLTYLSKQGLDEREYEQVEQQLENNPDDEALEEREWTLRKQMNVVKLKNLSRCLEYIQNDPNYDSKKFLADECVTQMDVVFTDLKEHDGGTFDPKDTGDNSRFINLGSIIPLMNESQMDGTIDALLQLVTAHTDNQSGMSIDAKKKKVLEGLASKSASGRPTINSSKLSRFSIEFEDMVSKRINTLYSDNLLAKAVLCAHFKLTKFDQPAFRSDTTFVSHMGTDNLITCGKSRLYFLRYNDTTKSFHKSVYTGNQKYEYGYADDANGMFWLSTTSKLNGMMLVITNQNYSQNI